MKRIGLLGGMSWESSAEYYRFVNEAVRKRLGGLHSADCLLRSVDFAAVEELQRTGRWNEAGKLLAAEAQALVAAGAGALREGALPRDGAAHAVRAPGDRRRRGHAELLGRLVGKDDVLALDAFARCWVQEIASASRRNARCTCAR